jgi:DNA-binding protein YbaB
MLSELSPVSRLIGEIQQDHQRLQNSYEQMVATTRQIAALIAALSNGVKRPQRIPFDAQRLDQQYQQLQQTLQTESRTFTAISNVLKTKHDTVKNSINNVR